MIRWSFLLLLACPIFTGCVVEQRKQAAFPIKVGLLADSQITSQNGFSDFHYRSKAADALVNVSIRPPALECLLAEEMLQVALNKLTQDPYGDKKGVDVILYLGDAANSGGTDEIETVLTLLGRYRNQTGTPIFIIIGNHDYLGAGNIVTPGIRYALLNRTGQPDNPALTKYEVLKKFSEFNHGNNRLPANPLRYEDNIEVLERNKNLDHRTGLYLCGILTYKEEGKSGVDIFLLDSSDYKDSPVWAEAANVGFFGVIGSVSFKDEPLFVSQTSLLKRYALSSKPQFRFLASHYPKDHLDRITFAKPGQVPLDATNFVWATTETAFAIPTFSKTFNQNLEPLLSSEGRNYWLSGHTHVPTIPRPERYIVGGLTGVKYFTGLNVGSTTDYRPHVAIVERYEQNKNNRLDNFVGYREIPLFEPDQNLLTSIPEAIGEYGRQHADDPNFTALIPSLNEWLKEKGKLSGGLQGIGSSVLGGLGSQKTKAQIDSYWFDMGSTILGLNRKYIEEAWQDQQTNASTKHLRNFIDEFVSRSGSNREEVISFLGLISGAYEHGAIAGKFNISPESFKKLCNNPK
jgi:predicted phosphodiesterase